MSTAVQNIYDQIVKLTIMETVELVKKMEDELGVSAAPVAVAGVAAAGGAAAAPAVEEQTEFNVVLESFGEKKVDVIKVVRELTSLGLKEAKALVESAPAPVKEAVSKADAEAMKKKLEEAGAKVTVK